MTPQMKKKMEMIREDLLSEVKARVIDEMGQSAPKEEKTKMAPETGKTVTTENENSAVVIQDVKQPVKVLNLDTQVDETVNVIYKRYSANDKAGIVDQLNAAAALVTPDAEKVTAFLNYASSQSYQAGKQTAFATGNFLTPELKRKIVSLLSNLESMAELSSKDIADRWLAGYKAKSPGAIKWLERAKALQETEPLDF